MLEKNIIFIRLSLNIVMWYFYYVRTRRNINYTAKSYTTKWKLVWVKNSACWNIINYKNTWQTLILKDGRTNDSTENITWKDRVVINWSIILVLVTMTNWYQLHITRIIYQQLYKAVIFKVISLFVEISEKKNKKKKKKNYISLLQVRKSQFSVWNIFVTETE